ncbi:MAG: glycosyltransferase family 2 protein, partial [Hyphomicrobiaceae bacterium]
MSVSVIIPCYNCERFIAEGIDSVLAQTLKDREVIVVDDGSIDGSAEMVRARYSSTVTVLHQGNKGAAAARNAGARAARCKHLMFLDAD